MQKKKFTLKGVCAYVLFGAMEEGKTNNYADPMHDYCDLVQRDRDRISHILGKILKDGRIILAKGVETRFVKL